MTTPATTTPGGEEKLLSLAHQWVAWDRNEGTREVIQRLLAENNVEQLREKLAERIAFGTAGLRGKMEAGFANMNDLTVIQASQGLCHFLLAQGLGSRGAVIGHDQRHNSERFARLAAGVFLENGVPVHFFRRLVHTPLVPFTVGHLKAGCGIMITASHNPKEDNGYKVYWENGAQINSPIDKGIADSIAQHLEPKHWNAEIVHSSPLCHDPVAEHDVIARYFDSLEALSVYRGEQQQEPSPVTFVYTAMHGVGHHYAVEAFRRFNLAPFHSVREQQEPDGGFPTVKFPNPEEGKDSLDLSIKYGDEVGATVILANDPDADRFSATEKQPSGQWRIFTGNEIGVLLAVFLLETQGLRSLGQKGGAAPKQAMLRSAVSSLMIDAVCKKNGVRIEETLTGFKWLGNRAIELEQEGYQVLMAYEEAIGFMLNPRVKDKDGISALAVFAEMTTRIYREGSTLAQKMEDIFRKYGYFLSNNSYFLCYSNETKQAVFDAMRYRAGSAEIDFAKKIGSFEIERVRDLQTGYDSLSEEKRKEASALPSSKSNLMVTFFFTCGATATIRTSGTEPKIKFYIEHHGGYEDKDKVAEELEALSSAIIEFLLQPRKFDLKERPTK